MTLSENWAGNIQYRHQGVTVPQSIDEICGLVRRAARVKVIGSRHSFNEVADTTGLHLDLTRLNRLVAVNPAELTAEIEGGAQFIDICPQLDELGFALHNLASLANVTVAGACATATHGSGNRNAALSAAVVELELVDGRGALHVFREDGPDFPGVVVNLGALGVVTRLKLRLVPSFQVRQTAFLTLREAQWRENFARIMTAGYSVSLYTDWSDLDIRVALVKQREDEPQLGDRFFGAEAATVIVGSLGQPDQRRSEQLGVSRPWYLTLPHFRPDHRPPAGNELQSEYYVDPADGPAALAALGRLRTQLHKLVIATEIRSVAADRNWMSPFNQRARIGIHFTWKRKPAEVIRLLPEVEKVLAPFNPVPHWGKLFTFSGDQVRAAFPKLPEFRELARRLDPDGKFRNDFLDQYVY